MNRYSELNEHTRKCIDTIINTLAAMPSIQDQFHPIAMDVLSRLELMTRLEMFKQDDARNNLTIKCGCGKIIRNTGQARYCHKNTNYHREWLANQKK